MRGLVQSAFLLGCLAVEGCSFGLNPVIDTTLSATDDGSQAPTDGAYDDETLPKTDVGLEGSVYRIQPSSMTVTQPPGLDALKDKMLERDILVFVASESPSKLGLSVAIAADDGEQDPCETVRAFPDADWSENPVFEAGPGEIDASFGGQPAVLRHTHFGGVFDADGQKWRDGTLLTQLDGRELRGSLGDVDVCDLVSAMGGGCEACDDGKELCFQVAIEDITANRADMDFDERNDGGRCQ